MEDFETVLDNMMFAFKTFKIEPTVFNKIHYLKDLREELSVQQYESGEQSAAIKDDQLIIELSKEIIKLRKILID